jgi:hypothetical protein
MKKFLLGVLVVSILFFQTIAVQAANKAIDFKPGKKNLTLPPLSADKEVYVVLDSKIKIPFEEIGSATVKGNIDFAKETFKETEIEGAGALLALSTGYGDEVLGYTIKIIKEAAREKGADLAILTSSSMITLNGGLRFYNRTFTLGKLKEDAKTLDIIGEISKDDKKDIDKNIAKLNKEYKGKSEAALSDVSKVEIVLNRVKNLGYTELGVIKVTNGGMLGGYESPLVKSLETATEFAKQKGANVIQLKSYIEVNISGILIFNREFKLLKK